MKFVCGINPFEKSNWIRNHFSFSRSISLHFFYLRPLNLRIVDQSDYTSLPVSFMAHEHGEHQSVSCQLIDWTSKRAIRLRINLIYGEQTRGILASTTTSISKKEAKITNFLEYFRNMSIRFVDAMKNSLITLSPCVSIRSPCYSRFGRFTGRFIR